MKDSSVETHKIVDKTASQVSPAKPITYEMTVSLWTGLSVSAALIGFFLFMKAVGLYQVLAFRYFNFIIFAIGIVIAFSLYKKNVSKNGIQYLRGIKMGMRIALIAIIPFALFIFIYLRFDQYFMAYIQENSEFGKYLSPISAAVVVAIEGFVGGAITTYMAMQYFKDNAT